ncbi:fumarate hydratase [Bacillus sp. JCM 19041]|uniref:fumarate hydratase n=1 Tax=Bacillus sp. JCM 19041 TaxID=1460637 RepID=UPI000A89951F
MREISYQEIVKRVSAACEDANVELGDEMIEALRSASITETSPVASDVLDQLLTNAAVAANERLPMCQDTGVIVCLVKVGQDCRVTGGGITDAINEGVRTGYERGYLRHSIVTNPFTREKSEHYNAPAIVHIEIVPGSDLLIQLTAKGGGAENMSALKMLKPSDGVEGVKAFVLDTVKKAGPNACPPLIVGVGVGGNFENCAYLAKKSLFRPIGQRSEEAYTAQLEDELIEAINALGIGPQGLGGNTTAIDVNIETNACHIAALPVAVNLNCHAVRHQKIKF